jgi:Na+-driven multidrug efflux pump
VLCLILDTFLVSTLPFSANLGINGIGYSNILTNAVLLVVAFILLSKEKIYIIGKKSCSFAWMREFAGVGGISGLESLVRNLAYMLMISRMVNMVNEQGTYWVANNFIWGWLLLPVLQLGELIKQEVSTNRTVIRKNSLGYFGITAAIAALWFLSVPVWKPFMAQILGFDDVEKLFDLVILLMGFYVPFAFQNVFDATFYGLGKTNYMLFESVTTNLIYYGGAFVLYKMGMWQPTLIGVALLFGFGNVFDSAASFLAYRVLLKKEDISILDVK